MGVAPFSIALDLCIELGGVASSDNLLTPHLCCKGGSTTDMAAVTLEVCTHKCLQVSILTHYIIIKSDRNTSHDL